MYREKNHVVDRLAVSAYDHLDHVVFDQQCDLPRAVLQALAHDMFGLYSFRK